MLGFLIGTACLIGLVKVLRWGRRGRGWGYGHACGHGAWHGHGCGHGFDGGPERGDFGGGPPWARGGFGGPGMWLRGLFERLGTSPEQEKVIHDALDELRQSGRKLKDELGGSRADVAKAVRSPSFDETTMGNVFARHDEVMDGMRKAVMGAIGKVHAVLDDRQRERLADLIENGPFGRGRWGGGPYRAWM